VHGFLVGFALLASADHQKMDRVLDRNGGQAQQEEDDEDRTGLQHCLEDGLYVAISEFSHICQRTPPRPPS
jgi:hypothetical protein